VLEREVYHFQNYQLDLPPIDNIQGEHRVSLLSDLLFPPSYRTTCLSALREAVNPWFTIGFLSLKFGHLLWRITQSGAPDCMEPIIIPLKNPDRVDELTDMSLCSGRVLCTRRRSEGEEAPNCVYVVDFR
jgi:hypothetical protein